MPQGSRGAKNGIYEKLGKFSSAIQGFVKKITTPRTMTEEQRLRLEGPRYPQDGMNASQREILRGIAADQDARNAKARKKK